MPLRPAWICGSSSSGFKRCCFSPVARRRRKGKTRHDKRSAEQGVKAKVGIRCATPEPVKAIVNKRLGPGMLFEDSLFEDSVMPDIKKKIF
jgi:hypothetical protein